MISLLKRIVQWNKDRKIPHVFDHEAEYGMLQEELDEFDDAAFNQDIIGIVDSLADLIVVATGSIWKLGYDPDEVMEETLKEIESRGGAINTKTGKWEKQLSGNEYKADYGSCKIKES